jgi:hypothetical protein
VCTGHCIVQCPVHRQPRAKYPFSCALSGGSPDSYRALSGMHRTGTVDCPVRPYSVFKKFFPLSHPRPGFISSLLCPGLCALAVPSPSPASSPLRRPPAILRRPRASLLPPLVSILCSRFLSLSLFSRLCSPPISTLLCQFPIPVKSSKSKWWNVFQCSH